MHVVTTVADGYAPIALLDAVVPFVSPYRPLWLGLGAVAFDLLLALTITSLLRARIGYRALARRCTGSRMPPGRSRSCTGSARAATRASAGCRRSRVACVALRRRRGPRARAGARPRAAAARGSPRRRRAARSARRRSAGTAAGPARTAGPRAPARRVAPRRRVRGRARPRRRSNGRRARCRRRRSRRSFSGSLTQRRRTDGDSCSSTSAAARAAGARRALDPARRAQPIDDGGVAMTASGASFGRRRRPTRTSARSSRSRATQLAARAARQRRSASLSPSTSGIDSATRHVTGTVARVARASR